MTEETEVIVNGRKQTIMMPKWKRIGDNIEPLMNSAGINATMYVLNLGMTTNIGTGNTQVENVRKMSFYTYSLLIRNYYTNYQEYGFRSLQDANLIAYMIFMNIYAHLSKSQDMGLLKQLMSSYNINEIRNVPLDNKPQQQGVTI